MVRKIKKGDRVTYKSFGIDHTGTIIRINGKKSAKVRHAPDDCHYDQEVNVPFKYLRRCHM